MILGIIYTENYNKYINYKDIKFVLRVQKYVNMYSLMLTLPLTTPFLEIIKSHCITVA